jgi:predicted nucleic-acid-binding protein
MRAADTNVLIRLVVRDNARQVAAAARFVEQGVWISTLALAEAVWALSSVYGRSAAELAEVVEVFLNQKGLTLENPDAVSAALRQFRLHPKLGFNDCLMLQLARKAGHLPLGTFDRALGKIEGCQKL